MENHGGEEESIARASLMSFFLLGLPPRSADQQPPLDFTSPIFVVQFPAAAAGSDKPETFPASKASIDAMLRITVTEDCVDDCAICLDEINVGGESREMPCKHRFHSSCIVKWLGIHGSCPVCRFMMPVDDGSDNERRHMMGLISVNLIVLGPVDSPPESDSDSGSSQMER